ncbi:MAG: 4Fe-4S binding protein [Roseburia sp.]
MTALPGKREKKIPQVNKSRCVACGECAYVCPKGAIFIKNGCFAEVNPQECVGCGLCSRSCPAGCISMITKEEER